MESDIRSGPDIGRTIRAIRSSRNLTRAEAAEISGIDPSYLAKIEQGRTVSLLEHELRILRRLGARVTITYDA